MVDNSVILELRHNVSAELYALLYTDKIMAYMAADKNGDIHIFSEKPERHTPEVDILCIWTYHLKKPMKYVTKVNKRICKTITGKILTWDDEPVRL